MLRYMRESCIQTWALLTLPLRSEGCLIETLHSMYSYALYCTKGFGGARPSQQQQAQAHDGVRLYGKRSAMR